MARKTKHPPGAATRSIVPDFELWTKVARSVTPLSLGAGSVSGTSGAVVKSEEAPDGRPKKETATVPRQAPKPPVSTKATPPLSGLDRRTSRMLTRGKMEIDDRIDLHGESGETARVRLKGFLSHAHSRGARTVLVITGKGRSQFAGHTLHGSRHFHAPERLGRLRRLVTQWFEETEFRALVAGYQPAHPKHGGGGAFYVRLRRGDKNSPLK